MENLSNTKRYKRPHGSPAPQCSDPDCKLDARTKGLCPKHYARSRKPLVRRPCGCEECPTKVNPGRLYCKVHTEQFERWGLTWIPGNRPKAEIRKILDAQRGVCELPKCTNISSSSTSRLCSTHTSDRSRKGCSIEEYLAVMSPTACEACGDSTNRLVTDHRHDHHPGSLDKMCPECIRGRLCSDCNTALGLLREDETRIEALRHYLLTRC